MKKILHIAILFLLVSLGTSIKAQNLYNYSLFNQNPEIYNPSGILSDDIATFFLTSRLQWAGIDGFPKYNSIGASFNIDPKMAMGVSVFNSTHGVINNMKAKASYAYNIKFSKNHNLSVGLGLGVVSNNIFYNQLQYVDLTDDLIQPENYNKLSFTSAFGLTYMLKGFEMQLVLPQLYEFNKVNLYGIGIVSYSHIFNKIVKVKPSVLVRNTELNQIQGDVMLNVEWRKKIWVQAGARSNGSLIFGIGNQTIGYAYETPTNTLNGITVGTHEILLKFRIKKDRTCPAYQLM